MPSTFVPPSLPAPLSLAALKKLRAKPLYRIHVWRETAQFNKTRVLLFALAVICGIAMCFSSPPSKMFIIFAGAAGLSMVLLLIQMMLIDFMDDDFDADPLPKSHCAGMLEMLNTLPDGEAFRKAMMEQGREFTRAEFNTVWEVYNVARSHKARVKDAKSCKALYGIPA